MGYDGKTEKVRTEYTQSARRRGVKKYLMGKGVRIEEMAQYLREFLYSYGHTGLDELTLNELLDKGSLYIISLKKYTNGKFRN